MQLCEIPLYKSRWAIPNSSHGPAESAVRVSEGQKIQVPHETYVVTAGGNRNEPRLRPQDADLGFLEKLPSIQDVPRDRAAARPVYQRDPQPAR